MTELSYQTRLTNGTKRPLMVHELNGPLVEIQPGQFFEVESRNPATMYARWSEVKWHEGGEITFVARPGFSEPERGRWVTRLQNLDGKEVEFRTIGGVEKMIADPDDHHVVHVAGGPVERPLIKGIVGGQKICLPRNIPVLVGLKLDDPLVKFKSMTIVRKRVMLKDPEHEGYCIFTTVLADETELRDASELKALEKILSEKS